MKRIAMVVMMLILFSSNIFAEDMIKVDETPR